MLQKIIRKISLEAASLWMQKSLAAMAITALALLFARLNIELIIEQPLYYAVLISVLLFNLVVLFSSMLVAIYLALNINPLMPFLMSGEHSIEKISQQTNFSPFKIDFLLTAATSVLRFWR